MELQAMDLAEVRNLVKWLDEQQRRGRQETAVLQQQFENQQREMSEMARRMQELEQQLPSMQSQIARLAQVDQQMDNLKTEIVHLIEQADDRRVKSEKEMERLRMVEHQANARAIVEVRDLVKPIPRLVDEMQQRRSESDRLTHSTAAIQNDLTTLTARLDERVRDVAYLEEAQRQDARRIAELQQALLEAQKRTDDLQAKQLVISDTTQRTEAKVERLVQAELDRGKQVAEFIEQAKQADLKRVQDLNQWNTTLEEFEELMAGYAKQWRLFDEQHRLNKEATAGLQEFKAGLERRLSEVTELQRIEDERLKQQWTEFLAEDDRRQKQRKMEAEQWAAEQQRQRENYSEQFQALQNQLSKTTKDIKDLYLLQEKYADSFRQLARIWMENYESIVTPPITRKVPG